MRNLFDHRNQQITRCFRYKIIIALSALLLPTVGWAHSCGNKELAVDKGNTIEYSIKGGHSAGHEIIDEGDPLVATIESPSGKKANLIFKITGTGEGITAFKINWKGPVGGGTCSVKVTVSG
jgi:hypothetical protein